VKISNGVLCYSIIISFHQIWVWQTYCTHWYLKMNNPDKLIIFEISSCLAQYFINQYFLCSYIKRILFSKHQDLWLSNKSKFFARYCSKHFMMRNNCRWIIPKEYAWYFELWCAFHATLLTTTWTILWKHLILHIPGIEN